MLQDLLEKRFPPVNQNFYFLNWLTGSIPNEQAIAKQLTFLSGLEAAKPFWKGCHAAISFVLAISSR